MHYLSDQELSAVQRVITDPVALQALKKIILAPVYSQGVLEPGKPFEMENAIYGLASHHLQNGLSNEIIGQDVRAVVEGIRLVKKGFDDLEKLRPVESPESPIKNPAR